MNINYALINDCLLPCLTLNDDNKTYELDIYANRHKRYLKELAMSDVPSIIKDLNDDETTIVMVDANLKREYILPSEKAYAYRMKLEAIKYQGRTSDQLGYECTSIQSVANESSDSKTQVQRYIRLTCLILDLLKLVDEEKIALTPAVELS